MTRLASLYIAVTLAACTTTPSEPVGIDPGETADGKADGSITKLPDVTCAGAPDAGPTKPLRHSHHELVIDLGGAHHRGIDLVANAESDEQTIAGEISYNGLFDKALEDENVDVFACRAGAWKMIGSARTDDEGRFALRLTGGKRLPIGFRDMAVSVQADRTSARFVALVATADTSLAVSDVDGTLTTSEAAFAANVFGIDADIHDGAAEGWQAIARRGTVPVYLTARARKFTEDTREWLAKKGMPRGVLRLADHVLLPGGSTVEFKTAALQALELPIDRGVGNRASDIEAYTAAGIAPDHIFIKLPEYELEVADAIAEHRAIGFASYPGPITKP
jgi:phosphatidate phosphatase PAH1